METQQVTTQAQVYYASYPQDGDPYRGILDDLVYAQQCGYTDIEVPSGLWHVLGGGLTLQLLADFQALTGSTLRPSDSGPNPGSLRVKVTAPMPSARAVNTRDFASPPSDSDAASTKKSKRAKANGNAPRPKNQFVLYRLDESRKVKEQFPGMHNTDVSKVVGRRWRALPQSVRDEYKRRAEEEKKQHAIDNPGYQYQPRKPSEKKKRMTKNKLAKMAAAAGPAQESEQTTTTTTFTPPYQNNTPRFTNLSPSLPGGFFNVTQGAVGGDKLHEDVALLSSQNPQLQANTGMGAPGPSAGVPNLNRENLCSTQNGDNFDFGDLDFDVDFSGLDFDGGLALPELAYDPTTSLEETHTPDPYAEQRRQQQIDELWCGEFLSEEGLPPAFGGRA